MQQGNGTERLLVMHNDFLIIGPEGDPSHVKGDASALDAMKKIADAQVPFTIKVVDSEGDEAWERVSCGQCGRQWDAVYRFSHIEINRRTS